MERALKETARELKKMGKQMTQILQGNSIENQIKTSISARQNQNGDRAEGEHYAFSK